jgi:hypothetical protein
VRKHTRQQIELRVAPDIVEIRVVVRQKDVVNVYNNPGGQSWYYLAIEVGEVTASAAKMARIDKQEIACSPIIVDEIGLLHRVAV